MRVNGEAIDVATALRLESLHDNKFLAATVNILLLRQYAEKNNIRNTDQELQLAADELRYSRGLEAVEAVHQWMRESHQTVLSVQEGIDSMLIRNKIRNGIPDSEVQAYYAEHQLEFETVTLYSIRVDNEDKAKELLSQINEEGANFHVLAMEHSQDEDTRHLGGHVGKLGRSQVTGAVEAAVFKAKPGTVIGPVKTDHGWNLFKVAAVNKPGVADAASQIRLALMEQLTTKLAAEATIDYPVFNELAAEA
jgi:parvulin-like peptidyl-prolyl isomerase